MTPEGQLFFSKGVNFLDPGKESPKSLAKQAFYWGNFYPAIRHGVAPQAPNSGSWGFNTRGGWSDPSPESTLL